MHPLPELVEHWRQQGRRFEGYDAVSSAEYREFVDLLASDSEDEGPGKGAKSAEEQRRQEEEERKKLEEEILERQWACEVCTLLNAMADGVCGVCGQGRRPSMEQLIAAARAPREEEAETEASKVAPKCTVAGDAQLRLRFLARDLGKFVRTE